MLVFRKISIGLLLINMASGSVDYVILCSGIQGALDPAALTSVTNFVVSQNLSSPPSWKPRAAGLGTLE